MKMSVEEFISKLGGVEKAFEKLEMMRQHSECCEVWTFVKVFGKGRASRPLKGYEIHPTSQYNESGFTVEDVERALRTLFMNKVDTVEGLPKVLYASPETPPATKFGLSPSNYWEESEALILKCEIHGEIQYHIGKYTVSNYEGGKSGFRIKGFNGDWNETVRGWAYV